MTGDSSTQVVLDADGVFLRERPYWRTALATALVLADGAQPSNEVFRGLDIELFDRRGVQRILKAAGVNSNWHLAGALLGAVRSEDGGRELSSALQEGAWDELPGCWLEATRAYVGTVLQQCDARSSPTECIEREPWFQETVSVFQQVFHGHRSPFDIEPRYETLGDASRIRATFQQLRQRGVALSICTGRPRPEFDEAMRCFDLYDCGFLSSVTHDEVQWAEQATSASGLSKPHWFPLAAAVIGLRPAMTALSTGRTPRQAGGRRAIFVGDGMSDFRATRNCRDKGLDVVFLLAESEALSPESIEEVRRAAFTIGSIEHFDQLPTVLEEMGS